jgi:hypothetical protein
MKQPFNPEFTRPPAVDYELGSLPPRKEKRSMEITMLVIIGIAFTIIGGAIAWPTH